MKFAFCVFKYFPFGGLERNCLRMAQVAVERGHHVDIYCLDWQGEKPSGINVVELSVNALTNHGRAAAFSKKMQKIFAKTPYDVVVGFNRMPGLDVFYAADVCYEHDVQERHGALYRLSPRYRIYSAFERAVFSPESKTEILSIVDAERDFCKQYYKTPDKRFHDVPPGIARDRMAPDNYAEIRNAVREEWSIPEDDFIIAFTGSDFRRKGLARLLCAVAKLPSNVLSKTHIWVLGKSDAAAYKSQAKKLGIGERVNFLGARSDIPRLFFSADCLVHPAIKEATGGVLLEALVSGLPVIATSVCGFAPHIEKAGAGVVLPDPFNQTELNNALRMLLTSTELSHWKASAIAYGRKEDLYSRAEKSVAIFEEIGKRRKV